MFWEHEGNRAVRSGQWKLVAQHGQDWELYDMEEDRTELKDLSHGNRARVQEMSSCTTSGRVGAAFSLGRYALAYASSVLSQVWEGVRSER